MGSSVSNIVKKATSLPRKIVKTVKKNPALLLAAVPFVAPAAFAGVTGGLGSFATAAGRRAILTSALKRAAINAAAQKLAGGKVDLKGALISGGIGAAVPNIGPISGIQNDMLREAVTGGITSLGTQLARGQGIDLKQAALAGGISGGLQGLQNVQQGGQFFGGVDKTAGMELPPPSYADTTDDFAGTQLGEQPQITQPTFRESMADVNLQRGITDPSELQSFETSKDYMTFDDSPIEIGGATPVTPLPGGFIPSEGLDAAEREAAITAKRFPETKDLGGAPVPTETQQIAEGGKDLFFQKDDIQSLGQRYDNISSAVKAGNYMDALREVGGAAMDRPLTSIALSSLVAGAMATPPGEEDDEFDYAARKSEVSKYLRQYGSKFYSGADLDAFVSRNLSEYAYGGRVGAMGGGIMGVPIRDNGAGTMELDYRAKGGFVPVGVKEKADDVPAMLSKNEFVMTADAVRGAGNGDIERGAQKMYNTMKKLESRIS